MNFCSLTQITQKYNSRERAGHTTVSIEDPKLNVNKDINR